MHDVTKNNCGIVFALPVGTFLASMIASWDVTSDGFGFGAIDLARIAGLGAQHMQTSYDCIALRSFVDSLTCCSTVITHAAAAMTSYGLDVAVKGGGVTKFCRL